MDKINFENGTLLTPAKVTIDGVDYIVTPAERSGNTPISAHVLNLLQRNIEKSVVAVSKTEPTTNERVWIKKGKNRFNKNKIVPGYVSADGNVYNTGGHNEATSDFIKIEAGQSYTASVRDFTIVDDPMWIAIGLYDKNGNFITRYAENDVTSLTITQSQTANACYVRFSYRYNDNNIKCQFEPGSTATSYEAFVDEEIYIKNDNGVFEKLINTENSDTGWISMTQYINDTYFAARPGYEPKARRIGDVVYWKGEVYCKTAVGSQIADLLIGIPVIFRPNYQVSVAGFPYKGDTEAYNMFLTGIGNVTVSEKNNIVAADQTYGFQLGNLSGYLVD